MTAVMLAILLAGIAATVFVVRPAHDEYDGTRREEEHLRRAITKEEEERARLEMLARGLDQDERVVERMRRDQGAGKPGEIRYTRPPESRPGR